MKFIPKDVFAEYRQKAQGMWQDEKPEKWRYAIPIIVVWFVVLGMIVSVFVWQYCVNKLTDHNGFYEHYSWKFYCMSQGNGEEQMSRMYIHR